MAQKMYTKRVEAGLSTALLKRGERPHGRWACAQFRGFTSSDRHWQGHVELQRHLAAEYGIEADNKVVYMYS